jgi:SAM-dependent methyltransferase
MPLPLSAIKDRLRQKCKLAVHHAVTFLRKTKYSGYCTVCGNPTIFYHTGKNLRETFVCKICNSTSRNRYLAKVLQDLYGVKPPYSLRKFSEMNPELAIYEASASGPIHNALKHLKGYVCSEFFYDIPGGQYSKSGVRSENIESLTFADNSLDLVITQDVFEHVRLPEKGFTEIHRVLKTGGAHIFTVPTHPFEKTRKRIEVRDGKEIYLLPKTHHFDPTRGGLVYTDFGHDLPDILEQYGFSTKTFWCSGVDGIYFGIYWAGVFVSVKR